MELCKIKKDYTEWYNVMFLIIWLGFISFCLLFPLKYKMDIWIEILFRCFFTCIFTSLVFYQLFSVLSLKVNNLNLVIEHSVFGLIISKRTFIKDDIKSIFLVRNKIVILTHGKEAFSFGGGFEKSKIIRLNEKLSKLF